MRLFFDGFNRVPNKFGELRCTQAVHIMVVEMLTGSRMTMAEADQATGYVPGRETWPYKQLEWFSANGFEVLFYDGLDARSFARDPIETLKASGMEEDLLEHYIKISNFDREAEFIVAAIRNGTKFRNERPSVDTITEGLANGWLPVVSADLGVLNGTTELGFQGHALVATGFGARQVRLQDPGPPPSWDRDVDRRDLLAAMRSPTANSGTVTLIRRQDLSSVKQP